jgi:hypothetical protein
VRNPAEAYNLKDVEWVIEGSEKHVRTPVASVNSSWNTSDNQPQLSVPNRLNCENKYLDVVDEVELLKSDLDAVSRDLDRLSKGNNVELHATFDKFGENGEYSTS